MQSSSNPLDDKKEQLRKLKASYNHDLELYNNLVTRLQSVQFELADKQEELSLLTSESDKIIQAEIAKLQANITLFSANLKNEDTALLQQRIKETAAKIEQLETEITGKKVNSDSPSFLR